MTFNEWLSNFFAGMPTPPPHVVWAYQSAYQAAIEPMAGISGQ